MDVGIVIGTVSIATPCLPAMTYLQLVVTPLQPTITLHKSMTGWRGNCSPVCYMSQQLLDLLLLWRTQLVSIASCHRADPIWPGAMVRKQHVQDHLAAGVVQRATVDHCNYVPAAELSYAKATDYYNNLAWQPTGYSGDGRCDRNGVRT